MATWTRRVPSAATATGSSSNTTSYASAASTPVAGELLVVCTDSTGSLATAPTLTASANSITFTKLMQQSSNPSVNARKIIWVADQLVPASPVSMTVTLTFTSGDAGTGASIFVHTLSGMTRVGADAVRTVGGVPQDVGPDDNIAASTTPSITLPAAPLSTNPLLAFIGNVTGTGTAPTAPTGWTTNGIQTYSTPTKGSYVYTRNSGETSATITWGSSSSLGGVQAVEFDASAPGAGQPFKARSINRVALMRASTI